MACAAIACGKAETPAAGKPVVALPAAESERSISAARFLT